MAAQTGIAGSTKIGEDCIFGGQAGIAGHLHIGNKVTIGARTGISNNVRDGKTMFGSPAMEASKYSRSNAVFRNLPELSRDVEYLKKKIDITKEEKRI
jgi:UDP-3-O-[3-hydroxymyristoyl] glucosamine N-acyltransferase